MMLSHTRCLASIHCCLRERILVGCCHSLHVLASGWKHLVQIIGCEDYTN
jgi:hypothetical protein